MYESPTLTNANIKSIISNTIIMTCLRIPLNKKIVKYCTTLMKTIIFIEIQARFTNSF